MDAAGVCGESVILLKGVLSSVVLRSHKRNLVYPVTALVLLSVCLGVIPSSACPDVRVYRGDISIPTSWEGTVRVTGQVVIRQGVTVTVDPGAKILVRPQHAPGIIVRGRLLVRRISARPVLFETDGGCSSGSWGGIVFEPGSVGILEEARLRCVDQGLSGDLKGVMQKNVVLEGAR